MMESGHVRHPSFGLRWEFTPGQDLGYATQLERMGFSYWSLRLETHLKYSGPLGLFFQERAGLAPLRLFSSYLPVSPVARWDDVHQLAMIALLETTKVARLTCSQRLPQIPSPSLIIRELLGRVPITTEVNLFIDEGGPEIGDRPLVDHIVDQLKDEISLTLSAEQAQVIGSTALERHADLITEVVLDPRAPGFSAPDAAKSICRILEHSRGSETLDLTFVLPAGMEQMPAAAAMAVDVRDRVLAEGWSR